MAKIARTWMGISFWFQEVDVNGRTAYELVANSNPMAKEIRTVQGIPMSLEKVTISGVTAYELVVQGVGGATDGTLKEWTVGGPQQSLTDNLNGTYTIAPAIAKGSAKMYDGAGRVGQAYWGINDPGTLLTLTYPEGEVVNQPILEGRLL